MALDFLSLYSVYCSTFYSLLRGSKVTFQFEKLQVYQKSLDFADEICSTTEQFSRGYGFLVDQLNRAALSFPANIAEGNGRFTKADRKNFFIIARGSVQECVPLLELARRRTLVNNARHAELKAGLEEISKMLSGLINGLEKRKV
jgi:four helix bundle protein